MNEISKRLKEAQKAQQEELANIEKQAKLDVQRIRRNLKTSMSENINTIETDLKSHQIKTRQLLLKPTMILLWATVATVLLIVSIASFYSYTLTVKIKKQSATLAILDDNITSLRELGITAKVHSCGDSEVCVAVDRDAETYKTQSANPKEILIVINEIQEPH